MPGGVDPVLRFMVKFYMPDPSQLEEEYTRYVDMLIMLIMLMMLMMVMVMICLTTANWRRQSIARSLDLARSREI